MKTLKMIISQAIYGIGVGMLGKVFLENVLGWGSTNYPAFLETQMIFLVASALGGLSFIWMHVEFKKGIHQYLAVILTYLLSSNIVYAIFVLVYSLEDYIESFTFMNVFWLIVCTFIYLAINGYYYALTKQLNKKLSEKE